MAVQRSPQVGRKRGAGEVKEAVYIVDVTALSQEGVHRRLKESDPLFECDYKHCACLPIALEVRQGLVGCSGSGGSSSTALGSTRLRPLQPSPAHPTSSRCRMQPLQPLPRCTALMSGACAGSCGGHSTGIMAWGGEARCQQANNPLTQPRLGETRSPRPAAVSRMQARHHSLRSSRGHPRPLFLGQAVPLLALAASQLVTPAVVSTASQAVAVPRARSWSRLRI